MNHEYIVLPDYVIAVDLLAIVSTDNILVSGVIQEETGKFIHFERNIQIASTSTLQTEVIFTTTGKIIYLCVSDPDQNVTLGSIWVRVYISRGKGEKGNIVNTLSEGLVSSGRSLGLGVFNNSEFTDNNGVPSLTTPANPSVATKFSQSPSGDIRFKVESIIITLTTDSNAANREVVFTIENASNTDLIRIPADRLQIADKVQIYSFIKGYNPLGDSSSNEAGGNLPDIVYEAAFDIDIEVTNMQAGDQLSAIALHLTQYINKN